MIQFFRYRPDRLSNTANGSLKRKHVTEYSLNVCAEGDVIVKVVGRVVRGPAMKKAKPFEVGKTYDSTYNGKNGGRFTVLAILYDGTVVTRRENTNSGLGYLWDADGSYRSDGREKLVPEYEEVPGGLTIEEIKE